MTAGVLDLGDRSGGLADGIPGEIGAVYWKPSGQMKMEDWVEIGNTFQQIERSIRFWLGDWLNYGAFRYGETYTQAVEAVGHKVEQLREFKWVCGAVPVDVRREESWVTWSHHKIVAKQDVVDTGLQAELLAYAAQCQIPSREFKDLVLDVVEGRKGLAVGANGGRVLVVDLIEAEPLADQLLESDSNRDELLLDEDEIWEYMAEAMSDDGQHPPFSNGHNGHSATNGHNGHNGHNGSDGWQNGHDGAQAVSSGTWMPADPKGAAAVVSQMFDRDQIFELIDHLMKALDPEPV